MHDFFLGTIFKYDKDIDDLVENVINRVPVIEKGSPEELRIIGYTRLAIAEKQGILTNEFVQFAVEYVEKSPEIIGI